MGSLAAFLGKHLGQIGAFWNGLSTRRKIILVVSGLMVFAGIMAFRWLMVA